VKTTIKQLLAAGTVIPAHPLALTPSFSVDEPHQRRLTRYYLEAGAGGVAVGVHTTQFEIRDAGHDLLEPALRMAAEEIDGAAAGRPIIKVAGICGPVEQALQEAELALKYGYHLGLVSNGGLPSLCELDLLKRTEKIGEVIPVFGFYLQPAVGGRFLSFDFWKDFAEIPNVHAIKVAPFNRYQTLDVVRAVCHASRHEDIALYTGNDDHIILDLLTTYRFNVKGKVVEKDFVGGLLGHWAFWTKHAVAYFERIKKMKKENAPVPEELLHLNNDITDINAAVFDPAHHFKGCLSGIHEMLRRQGLMRYNVCLNPDEKLSPGQMEEIERIHEAYPEYRDAV
jgi:hypothetical protein